MDTETAKKPVDPADEQIQAIKRYMPRVYEAIRARAAAFDDTYKLVRRGARGEPGCFYAFEADREVGTPFSADVPTDVAQLVARYGMTMACVWPDAAAKEGNGKT
jgi:hypothetical protein